MSQADPADQAPRVLVLGAHPDDADFHAGGYLALCRQRGFDVLMISVTDGASGHHRLWGPELAARRRREAEAAGQVIGARYQVWDFPDGYLEPSLELRERIIRTIRSYRPDLVLTHRTNDYHPDHRAVGQAVQDASYMVTVPAVCPDVPALRRDPVVAYMCDLFTKPVPLEPDVVLDITGVLDTVVRMLACHESQVFEWLPYNQRIEDQVPQDAAERLDWLRQWYAQRPRQVAQRFREALLEQYGPAGDAVEYAEAFEVSEYASPLDACARRRLFPMLAE